MNSSYNEEKSRCIEMERKKIENNGKNKKRTGTDLNMGNVILYVLIFSDPVYIHSNVI